MRIAIIGRTNILYETAERLRDAGHTIACILTAKAAPEYTRGVGDFEHLAALLKVPFASTSMIETQFGILQASGAEVGVSINYSGVIPKSVTDLFPLGILNAHGGDLPRYRGNACQAWAILNGEERIGLCIHRMIGGELDSGDIIARDYLQIDFTTKVTQAWQWMERRVPTLFLEAVNRLEADPGFVLSVQSKDPRAALRCYPRRPEDGRIDWTLSALQILRLVNASNKPYAGAFCEYDDRKLIIWDAELVDEVENFLAVPGQITRVGDGAVDVACGQGKLRILSAELADEVATPDIWINSIRQRLS